MTRKRVPLSKRLVFDLAAGEVRDDDRRYLLMRADVLMGALTRLHVKDRLRVLHALADSTAANGGKSLRAYQSESRPTPSQLLEIVRDSAAALGWGRWEFDSEPGMLVLKVENSPFAAGFGHSSGPVCAPISGMLRSVAEIVLNTPVEVDETACAAQGAGGICRFVARSSP